MSEPEHSKSPVKIMLLLLLIAAAVTALAFLLGTERGRALIANPHAYGEDVRRWVQVHAIIAPFCLIAAYALLTILSLPVWWLPVLAGYGFGLFMGIVWAQVSFTIGALAAAVLSRYLLSEWFHRRVESHLQRLKTLDAKMGHNGLWVVFTVRLAHVFPHGLSNYLFGLTQISLRDIGIGTFIGGLPGGLIGVAVGAGFHPWHDWRFIAAASLISILLITILFLRYLKPEWFKSMGIE